MNSDHFPIIPIFLEVLLVEGDLLGWSQFHDFPDKGRIVTQTLSGKQAIITGSMTGAEQVKRLKLLLDPQFKRGAACNRFWAIILCNSFRYTIMCLGVSFDN